MSKGRYLGAIFPDDTIERHLAREGLTPQEGNYYDAYSTYGQGEAPTRMKYNGKKFSANYSAKSHSYNNSYNNGTQPDQFGGRRKRTRRSKSRRGKSRKSHRKSHRKSRKSHRKSRK